MVKVPPIAIDALPTHGSHSRPQEERQIRKDERKYIAAQVMSFANKLLENNDEAGYTLAKHIAEGIEQGLVD